MILYHLTDAAGWRRALELGEHAPPSLAEEGFIHCCIKTQLADVLGRHFAQAQEVIILHIVSKRVKKILKWADLTYGYFPHLHGRLPLEAVSDLSILTRRSDGTWALDDLRLD